MKTTRILTVLVLALASILSWPEVSEAVEMGTAFTYQGHLYDNNDVANGLYDFQFSLYDVNVGSAAVANDVNVHDMDVIDGYFRVELDFGSEVFDGNAVWLEIGVRPGDQNDPNAYPPLSPRQEVTPVPYALQTRGIFVDDSRNVGIGMTSPQAKLDIAGGGIRLRAGGIYFDQGYQISWAGVSRIERMGNSLDLQSTGGISFRPDGSSLRVRIEPAGNVGIGANPPTAKLHIVQPGAGDIFRVDDTFIGDSSPFLIDDTGNVGIGTTSPGAKLEVNGPIKITDGLQGAGKVLTSDASGLASWQSPADGSGTHYWSCVGANFHPQYNDTSNTEIDRDGAYIEAKANSMFFFAPVMLPHGASVTKVVVYGNAAATAEDWGFRKINLNSAAMSVVESAKIGTEVTCSTPRTIDNNTYAYLLWTSSLDAGDIIYNAKITYTH